MRIVIGSTVLIALSLDDGAMQRELNVTVRRVGISKRYSVEGTPNDVAVVVSDIYSRSQAGEWDQPNEWMYACRNALASIKQQLAAVGFRIVIDPQRYMVRLTS